MSSLRYTRNLFLRAFCIVYLFAFISFYIQIPGLYGDNGILPAKSLLENSKHKTLSAKIHYQPTLLWLAPSLGLDTSYALEVLSLLGVFLAFSGLVSQKFCTIPLFAGLWSLYFSLYQIGQTFVKNSYDDLLLEAGFLALFVAPLLPGRKRGPKGSFTDMLTFWLVRWLLFRFLVTNGLKKFISGCPKWWTLTAFNYHFQSMPLPSAPAWYSHHIDQNLLKLVAVFVNIAEIVLPFLYFIPLRSVRVTGFVVQIFLQICIVLTGNFSFVNLLIVTLLLSLLDDQFFYGRRNSFYAIIAKVFNVILYTFVLYGCSQKLYSVSFKNGQFDSKIAFSQGQFDYYVGEALTLTLYVAALSFTATLLYCLYKIVTEHQGNKPLALLSALLIGFFGFAIFIAGYVPLASLHQKSNATINIEPTMRTLYNRMHKLRAVNEYALFPKMTGIDGRLEIVLEGANNIDGPWKEYNFLYKPGNVNHSLPFVAPYSPRLDWQFYWAAYSTYDKEPWLLSLVHRLLIGRPEVLSLLDTHHSPYPQNPPKFIRGVLYKYKFTSWKQRNENSWWTREKVVEYFPPFSKDSPQLVEFLRARNLLPVSQQSVNPVLKQILDGIRFVCGKFEATLLLWSVFTAGCAIIITSGKK